MSEEHVAPRGDDEIVPSSDSPDRGTADGVGEHVDEGLGSEGVQRMEGEFGDLASEERDGPATD